eukprot:1560413-Alexandrium_andersonii.AAC.1
MKRLTGSLLPPLPIGMVRLRLRFWRAFPRTTAPSFARCCSSSARSVRSSHVACSEEAVPVPW